MLLYLLAFLAEVRSSLPMVPTQDDFRGCVKALFRLQDTYLLQASTLASGMVEWSQTKPMTGGAFVIFLPLSCCISFQKYEIHLSFSVIPHNWDDAGNWNPSLWKARAHSSCVFHTMVVDTLATEGGIRPSYPGIRVSALGPRLNVNMLSYRYGNSRYKDKTRLRPSYPYNSRNPHT